jgi:hypothetical protein
MSQKGEVAIIIIVVVVCLLGILALFLAGDVSGLGVDLRSSEVATGPMVSTASSGATSDSMPMETPSEAKYPNEAGARSSLAAADDDRALYLVHSASIDAEMDKEQTWQENGGSIQRVSDSEFYVYVLDPGPNITNTRILEISSLDGGRASAYFIEDIDTVRGYAAKFKVVLTSPGRYYLCDEVTSGMNNWFAWMVEW